MAPKTKDPTGYNRSKPPMAPKIRGLMHPTASPLVMSCSNARELAKQLTVCSMSRCSMCRKMEHK